MDFAFTLQKKDKKTHARVGVIKTLHGEILTPAFSVVGTRASVRGLSPEDLVDTKTQVVLANAYHLYLEPGLETLKTFKGFAPFMMWNGPTITDSGGYQVSFLWGKSETNNHKVNITDKGMYFRSHIDGSKHLLSPEQSIEIQRVLGADIIMAMDQPMGFKFSEKENTKAYERTFKWEERSYISWAKTKGLNDYGNFQALFGIIQGQLDKNKRQKFLKFILSMGFPGIAIGDETIGSDPKVTAQSLNTIVDMLPDDKPLHALGLGGGPEGIFEAVERGMDIFDNSSITRLARTGFLFIYPQDGGKSVNKFRINIHKTVYKDDRKPLSSKCKCSTCASFSRSYIRHLLISKEILGARLATIHNVYFINALMTEIRTSIVNGDFTSLKRHWLT
jgi:tRNA-guanine transglycosylase